MGYRLGGTGGTSPRTASDFSIAGNRLTAAARNGNGRFEFSADGTSGFNFGSFVIAVLGAILLLILYRVLVGRRTSA